MYILIIIFLVIIWTALARIFSKTGALLDKYLEPFNKNNENEKGKLLMLKKVNLKSNLEKLIAQSEKSISVFLNTKKELESHNTQLNDLIITSQEQIDQLNSINAIAQSKIKSNENIIGNINKIVN